MRRFPGVLHLKLRTPGKAYDGHFADAIRAIPGVWTVAQDDPASLDDQP